MALVFFITLPRTVYLGSSHLVAVRVHGRQDVDAGVLDEAQDALVPVPELLAEEFRQLQQQLTAQHLVPVHVPHILDFWFHWKQKRNPLEGAGRRTMDSRPALST